MNMFVRFLSLATLASMLAPTLCGAYPNEPEGYGKVRFGMTITDVRKLYPEMRSAGKTAGAEEEGKGGISRYAVDKQSVAGLKGCEMHLQFAGNALYEIGFDCGREEKVAKALEKHFGPPSSKSEHGVFWRGDKTTVSMNPRAKTFAFSDNILAGDVQRQLLSIVLQGGVHPTPTGQPTPAAHE